MAMEFDPHLPGEALNSDFEALTTSIANLVVVGFGRMADVLFVEP